MRQDFLNQLEEALPAIMATAKVEEMEIPALARARDTAASAMAQHKRFRQAVTRNKDAARHDRQLINVLRELDAVYLSLPRDDEGAALAEAGEGALRRILAALDAVIEERDTNNQAVTPVIAQFSATMAPVVKTLKKIPAPDVRLYAGDAKNLLNAMIAANEASRDLVLALRVLRMRLETAITGSGVPANSAADVKDFLAKSWA